VPELVRGAEQALMVLVPIVVVALASWGGWVGLIAIGVIVAVGLTVMIRIG
jgi:hypothetical protein